MTFNLQDKIILTTIVIIILILNWFDLISDWVIPTFILGVLILGVYEKLEEKIKKLEEKS